MVVAVPPSPPPGEPTEGDAQLSTINEDGTEQTYEAPPPADEPRYDDRGPTHYGYAPPTREAMVGGGGGRSGGPMLGDGN